MITAGVIKQMKDYDGSTNLFPATLTKAVYNDANKSVDTLLGEKANKSTTLAGYGITDAKIVNRTVTLGSNSIDIPPYVLQLQIGETSSTAYAGNKGKAVTDLVGNTTLATTAKTVTGAINELKTNFQAGVDGIYNAVVAQGTTPASKSQSDVSNSIATLATNKYNTGNSAGKTAYEPKTATVTNASNITVKNAAGTTVLSTTTTASYDAGNTAGKTAYEPKTATVTNAGAITVKNAAGTTVLSTTTSSSYDAGVSATKVGTATITDVLQGKTFTSSSGVGLTGAMKLPSSAQNFVCVGYNGKSYYSANGTSWVAMTGTASERTASAFVNF